MKRHLHIILGEMRCQEERCMASVVVRLPATCPPASRLTYNLQTSSKRCSTLFERSQRFLQSRQVSNPGSVMGSVSSPKKGKTRPGTYDGILHRGGCEGE